MTEQTPKTRTRTAAFRSSVSRKSVKSADLCAKVGNHANCQRYGLDAELNWVICTCPCHLTKPQTAK